MNVGSLFSGIGGFDLGFERAGMRVSWQVELDPYCRAVLARHFPDAARFEDVQEVGVGSLDPVDLICGGFPCQDLSSAGRGAGIDGARSGLWSEFARIVRELRPRYVVVENVPALLTGKGKRWDRGPISRVLGDLAEAGYDAEWSCLSAREFGAPHLRKRVWIVAYPSWDAQAGAGAESGTERKRVGPGGSASRARELPHANGDGRPKGLQLPAGTRESPGAGNAVRRGAVPALADPEGVGERPRLRQEEAVEERRRRSCYGGGEGGALADAECGGRQGRSPRQRRDDLDGPATLGRQGAAHPARRGQAQRPDGQRHPASKTWSVEPGVGRVADGVPDRVDRLAALGNALVPQIAEWIGRRIIDYELAADRGSVS